MVLTKLLYQVARADWDATQNPNAAAQKKLKNEKSVEHEYIDFESGGLQGFYSVPPSPFDSALAVRCIDVILKIRSEAKLARGLAIVQKRLASYKPPSETTRRLDYYCNFFLFYLSASNWNDVFRYLTTAVTKASKTPSSEIIPLIDIMGLLFLDQHKVVVLIDSVENWASHASRQSQRELLYFFAQEPIRYWTRTNGKSAAELSSSDNPLSRRARITFEHLCKEITADKRPPVYKLYLSTIMTLINEPYRIPGNKRSKSSKRDSFFHDLEEKLSSNVIRDVVTSLQSFVFICGVAASIYPYYPNHPLVKYAQNMYGALSKSLFAHIQTMDHRAYDVGGIRKDFIAKFSILTYEQVERDYFQDLTSRTLPRDIKLSIIRGLRALESLPMGKDVLTKTLVRFSGSLLLLAESVMQSVFDFENSLMDSNVAKQFDYKTNVRILINSLILLQLGRSMDTDVKERKKIIAQLIPVVIKCIKSHDATLRSNSSNILQDVIRDSNSPVFSDSRPESAEDQLVIQQTFAGLGSSLNTVAQRILNQGHDWRLLESELHAIKQHIETRLYLIEHFDLKEMARGDLTLLEPAEARYQLSNNLEAALVYAITSTKIDVCKLALANLHSMVQEAMQLEDFDKLEVSNWSIVANFSIYSELSSSPNLYSPLAIHKQMTKLFQQVEAPSLALINVWSKIYKEWSLLTTDIMNKRITLTSDIQKEWKTFSGVLCSLLRSLINSSEYGNVPLDVKESAEKYLNYLILILKTENSFLHETSREVLSTEPNPAVYTKALYQIDYLVKEELKKPESVEVKWVTQITVLLRAILSRMREEKLYVPVEMSDLTMMIIEFVDKMSDGLENLRLACQVCYLLEILGESRDVLNSRHESNVKNIYVKILVKWLGQCSSSMFNITTSSSKHDQEMERLYIEKSLAVSKALSLLLDGLPLMLPDATHEKEEWSAKSAVFSNFFSLLLKTLGSFQEKESELKEMASSTTTRKHRPPGQDKIPLIINELIICMSNLLSANSEIGLTYALPLGYHKDDHVRLAFLQIFRNILSQDTKMSEAYNVKNKYMSMVNFLVNNMSVTLTLAELCPVHDVEEFSTALCGIFEYKQQLMELVKEAVKREIFHTDFPSDLLRRNCVATKVLLIFARSRGKAYLQRALGGFLSKMVENPQDYVFENTSNKLSDYQMYRENISRFNRCLEEVVQNLTAAEHLIPKSIREICGTIADAAEEKFPGSKNSAVNSFFFLRFVCPVLVSPEREGLLDPTVSAPIRRPLLQIAKTIQNIANSAGDSQARSNAAGPEISGSLSQKIIQLLSTLSSPVSSAPRVAANGEIASTSGDNSSIASSSSTRNLNIIHATTIHRFINNHWEDANRKMMMDIKKQKYNALENGNTAGDSHTPKAGEIFTSPTLEHDNLEMIKNLANLVTDLGAVASISKEVQTTKDTNIREFIERNRHRDLGVVIENHVIDHGMTRDGTHIIIHKLKNFEPGAFDTELIVYRYYQLLQKVRGSDYYLLIDCTEFQSKNLLPPAASALMDAVLTDDLAINCKGIYYLNIPANGWSHLKISLSRREKSSLFNPMRVPYHFITSFDLGLDSLFTTKSANLDPQTEKLTVDPKAIFNNVEFIMPYKSKHAMVSLKLGAEFLQILSIESYRFVSAAYGHYNDVFPLRKIRDAYVGSRKENPTLFYVELEGVEKPFSFMSQNRQEIVRALLSARRRVQKEIKHESSQFDLTEGGTIENKLPELLNMALTNLCSSSSFLQQAAYELLVMIPVRYEVDFGRTMRGGPRLGIPKKEITMALSLSESAAKSNPTITYDFLMNMFSVSRYFSSTESSNAVNYSAPWFKNVFTYVYMNDIENGSHKTARIIRQLLNLTCSQPDQYSALALNVWPSLCLEDGLSDLLVEEVVNFVTESALQDDALDSMLAVITAFPTLSMAGTVLKMIRQLLDVAPTGSGFSVEHPNWNVVEILTRICCGLTFDSLSMIEMFLPEFFFLITSFLYSGPLQFRTSLHSMFINLLHAFISSSSLSDDRRMHVMGLWQEACSLKGRLAFGLNDDAKAIDYDQFTLTGVSHVEYCSLMLLETIDTVGSVPEANAWRARWSSFAVKYTLTNNISLQCRSLVVLGCLANVEVEDEAIRRVLEIFSSTFLNERVDRGSLSSCRACALSCLSRMVESARENSVYPARLFWVALYAMKTVELITFTQALRLLQASLRVLDAQGSFKNTSIPELLLESRRLYEPEINQIEGNTYADLTHDNFYSGVLAIVMKGLEPASTREATAKTLEVLLEICSRNSVLGMSESGKYPGYLCYLYFLYLIGRTDSEMKDLLWIAGFPDASISTSPTNDEIPALLKAYIAEDSVDSTIVMYLGGQLFRVCNDNERVGIRFLKSLLHMANVNLRKKELVYSMVRDKLIQIIRFGYSPNLIRLAMEAALETLNNSNEFEHLAATRKELLSLIENHGFANTLLPISTNAVATNNKFLLRENEIYELNPQRRKLYYNMIMSIALK